MQHARPVNHWFCFTALLLIWVIPMMALPPSATAEPNEISFQEGVNSYAGTVDTYIMQAEPAAEHGTLESVEWDTDDPPNTSQYKYALIRFDNIFGSEPGQIPVGAVIQSAALTYTVWNNGNQANVHEATVGWSEYVTWNDFGSDAGVQVDEYGNFVATASGNSTGTYSIDVTASLSAWAVVPSANRGWIFRPTGTNGVDIWSSKYAIVGNRPKLVVNYDDTVTLPPNPPVLNSPADDATDVTTSPVLDVTVSDPDGNLLEVTFHGREALAGEQFTIIALPDTQYYSKSYPGIFTAQTQWIANEVVTRNIAFVTHEGDLVQNFDNTTEWERANTSMSFLDTIVPYGMAPGNHDQPTTFFNEYFPFERYENETWYGGHHADKNDNSFQLFSAGGLDFIILHLEFCPQSDIIVWAYTVLNSYPSRIGIITTHGFIDGSGDRNVHGCGNTQYIWDELVVPNDNVYFVLCGHVHDEYTRTDVIDGREVYQLLADYQGRPSGGNGWLRIMRFSPAEDTAYIETYSPYLDQYETDADSQFSLEFPMNEFLVIETLTAIPSGSNTSVVWSDLLPNTEYEWFVEVGDSEGNTQVGPIWRFTTGSGVPCEGDFDHDGDVDGADVALFAADFGRIDCSSDCNGDFEPDGDVDGSDLARLTADFGRTDCHVP